MIVFFVSACTVEATGSPGECKFMTDCPSVLNDYQKLKKMPTICDRKYRTVCCPMKVSPQAIVVTATTTTDSPRRISAQSEYCIISPNSWLKIVILSECRQYAQFVYENVTIPNPVFGEPPIPKRLDHCGHKVAPLIVGGENAKEREFPHMALVIGKAQSTFANANSSLHLDWLP